MKIKEFGVEIWMNDFETKCKYNLAETCVESLTVEELLNLAGVGEAGLKNLLSMKLTYGAIEGSDRLRNAIAALYKKQTLSNIVVTHGTIGANSLVHQALVSRGDHVISVIPTYQQHYSIPESIGAEVECLRLRPENNFLPDLDELREMVRPNTRLIAINNPNNPTGSLMDETFLKKIVEIARSCGAWLLCDEVYRGIDQSGSGTTAAIADLYEKGISTAGVSKSFSLAGLRLGWVIAPQEVIEAVMIHRDYNTISVGMINDYLATLALENHEALLGRSRAISRENLSYVSEWIEAEEKISWIKPQSGTTAFLKLGFDMSSREFCISLLEKTGVLLTPGSALDIEGYVRLGFAGNTQELRTGLEKMSEFLAEC